MTASNKAKVETLALVAGFSPEQATAIEELEARGILRPLLDIEATK